MPKAPRCEECGAQLKLGPDSCPLCGASLVADERVGKETDADSYRSNVRELREELRRLRSRDAEAV